jgi:hypothetical protein
MRIRVGTSLFEVRTIYHHPTRTIARSFYTEASEGRWACVNERTDGTAYAMMWDGRLVEVETPEAIAP